MILPNTLQPSDTVALLASSSPLAPDHRRLVPIAVSVLQSWGLQVRIQPDMDAVHGYLAGADHQRASYVQHFYTDPTIKALFFTRGGYGAARLFRYLDDDVIRHHHKIVVGYSDVSSLLLYFQQVCGIVVYHGPNLVTPRTLEGADARETLHSLHAYLFRKDHYPSYVVSVIHPGCACGQLVGGNLTNLIGTLGTPYAIETQGRILFVEDTGKAPHQIDRMLTHLRNAGKLDGIAGLVLADMHDCHGRDGLLWHVVRELFQDATFPVVYGLPSGHGPRCVTLPLGTEVELNADAGVLRYLPPQGRTTACSCLLPASAPLPLPAAAEAQR